MCVCVKKSTINIIYTCMINLCVIPLLYSAGARGVTNLKPQLYTMFDGRGTCKSMPMLKLGKVPLE